MTDESDGKHDQSSRGGGGPASSAALSSRTRLPIELAIFAVALWLRWSPGSPGLDGVVLFRNDELLYAPLIASALRRDLVFEYLVNPSLYVYVVAAVVALVGTLLTAGPATFADFALGASLDPGLIVVTGRVVTSLLGAASASLLCRIGWETVSPRAGVLAGLMLAINRVHVDRSSLLGNEVLMVFLTLVFFLAVTRYVARPGLGRHAFAGGVLGLAVATKYNAGVHLAVLAVASATALPALRRARVAGGWGALLAGFPTAGVTFLLGCLSVILHPLRFVDQFTELASYLHQGWDMSMAETRDLGWWFYVVNFPEQNNGLVAGVAALCGVLLVAWQAVVRRTSIHALLVAAILPCYLVLGSGIFSLMRFLLPAIPFILLAGAAAVDGGIAFVGRTVASTALPVRRRWVESVVVALFVAFLVPHARITLQEVTDRYRSVDPRLELVRWMRGHLDATELHALYAEPPRLRLLDRDWGLEAFGLDASPGSPLTASEPYRRYAASTFRFVDLRQLMQQAATLEDLGELLRRHGCRRLVMILNRSRFGRLEDLPSTSHERIFRDRVYWPEVVAAIRRSQPTVFEHQGLVVAVVDLDAAALR